MSSGRKSMRRWANLSLASASAVVWAFVPFAAVAQSTQKKVFTLDVSQRWYNADTVIDAMLAKAKACWVSSDPAFAGFTVAGKRLDPDGKIVWLDFKQAQPAKSRKATKKVAQETGTADTRVLRVFAVPTFSGGYGIGVEQSEGIDIIPSMERILIDLERRGEIGC